MRAVFKVHDNDDGSQTMWYSHKGRLMKVARYSAEAIEECDAATVEVIQTHDAEIFLRGFLLGDR